MSPRLRTSLVGIFASALAVWIGIAVAQEEYMIASLSAGISLWAILAWTTKPLAEAWALGFLFWGYVVGNRGFAQLAPIPGVPLFFSELGLVFVFCLVALRGAWHRTVPVHKDWLNSLLVCWLVLGAARIFWDTRTYGLLAVRDFAMVYYLLFFFAAQSLAAHASSHTLLKRSLIATFQLLPITGIFATSFPDFFNNHLLVQGVPLIFYKGDLLPTFLFTGFIILLPRGSFDYRLHSWRWLLALTSLFLGLSTLSRSSMVGLFIAGAWLAWSGRWRAFQTIGAAGLLGLVAVTGYSFLQKKDFTQTKAYAIYEAAASITDLNSNKNYQNEMSSNKGDNNRFRLVWWKNVIEETLTKSPVFGLGFGADLARGFLIEYYPTSEWDFTARSPHNIFITTLGRMGLLGAVSLLSIYWIIARNTSHICRRARNNYELDDTVTLQAALWVIMVSACLGVVLEGPMGAIPFWIMLGMAHYAAKAASPLEDTPIHQHP